MLQQKDARTISLAYLTVRGIAPLDQIECAHACGYTHVGFRFCPVLAGEHLTTVVGSVDRVAEIDDRLKSTGIKLLDVEFFWIRPDTNISEFEPYVHVAARLGAQSILVGANDPDPSRFAARWLQLCDLVAAYGLRAHLEFMLFADLATINSYAEGIALMESAAHPHAGLMLDPFQFAHSGGVPSQILPEHHRYMAYTQLCDAPAGPAPMEELKRQARADRLPPGRGGLDLAGLLEALPRNQPLSLEVPLGGSAQSWPAAKKAQVVYDAAQEFLARQQGSTAAAPR